MTDVLSRAGCYEYGSMVTTSDSTFSVAEIPTGWTILFSNRFDFASPEKLASLSAGTMLVACQAEEHCMFSAACSYYDGYEVWSVCHDRQQGVYDLSTRGAVPAELEPIKARLIAKQNNGDGIMRKSVSVGTKSGFIEALLKGFPNTAIDSGGSDRWMEVDYMFDVPVELAAELTGYRHDYAKSEWGQPDFRRLEFREAVPKGDR